jgi:hypothetical protein
MFVILKPAYHGRHQRDGFDITWTKGPGIEAPSISEAMAIAKAAGHHNPIFDDHRTPEKRAKDLYDEEVAKWRTPGPYK